MERGKNETWVRKLTCRNRREGDCWKEKHAVKGKRQGSRRLRIDLSRGSLRFCNSAKNLKIELSYIVKKAKRTYSSFCRRIYHMCQPFLYDMSPSSSKVRPSPFPLTLLSLRNGGGGSGGEMWYLWPVWQTRSLQGRHWPFRLQGYERGPPKIPLEVILGEIDPISGFFFWPILAFLSGLSPPTSNFRNFIRIIGK